MRILYCIAYIYIALYCIALYCILLYSIVLYSILLYYIILYYIQLYSIVFYCIVLYYTILYHISLYSILKNSQLQKTSRVKDHMLAAFRGAMSTNLLLTFTMLLGCHYIPYPRLRANLTNTLQRPGNGEKQDVS